jgi:sugar phosphate isomerase/epimerase
LWHSPLDVLKAVKGMDPRIGCCIDVGHTVRAGTDVVQAIHETGPRLFNVHMKDLTNFASKESQVAVGDGIMPVRKMFEALIAAGYKGFVDLEYEIHPDDPMPGVIASFAYMRGVLAGMGFASKDLLSVRRTYSSQRRSLPISVDFDDSLCKGYGSS